MRVIDLGSGAVRTVAGTGAKAHGRFSLGRPTETPLRSPWAVMAVGPGLLLIAMAGSHQIWALINEEQIGPFAGNGREAFVDGPRAEASFNQPSDLAFGLGHLFVADAEASAVRAVSLDADPKLITLVGQGLFEFSDQDGVGTEARLQHPTGVAFAGGRIYVADSYNHKVKRLDPTPGRVETLIGTGAAGRADGPFAEAGLFEPEGLALGVSQQEDGEAASGDPGDHTGAPLLYIADTNNHLIRVADLDAGRLHTLRVWRLERIRSALLEAPEAVRLPPATVAPGRVTLTLDIELPVGYKLNLDAPPTLRLAGEEDGAAHTFGPGEAPAVTVEVEANRELLLDLTLYYCQADDPRLCLIHDRRMVAPIHVESRPA